MRIDWASHKGFCPTGRFSVLFLYNSHCINHLFCLVFYLAQDPGPFEIGLITKERALVVYAWLHPYKRS